MPSDFNGSIRAGDPVGVAGSVFYVPRTPEVFTRVSPTARWNSLTESQRQLSEHKQQIEEYILTKIENGELII